MTLLEAAIEHARDGFKIFPLIPNSKIPLIKDWENEATQDEEKIKYWWKKTPNANIGISTKDIAVVDIDTKDPKKNGFETLARLAKEGKTFPSTMGQITPTGGRHFIYTTPRPIKSTAGKIGPGIDTRGVGGYVVAGSSTIGDKKYTNDRYIKDELPKWVVDELEATPKQHKNNKKPIEVNKERALKEAAAYLCKVHTTEGERNHQGYVVANKLKDIGLDRIEVLTIMMEDWDCQPSLELDELKGVVDHAFKYGVNAQGAASPEASFEAIETDGLPDEGNPIDRMNKEFAMVLVGGKHQILQETTNHKKQFEMKLINEEAFHRIYNKEIHQLGNGKTMTLSKFWVGHEKRRTYKGIVFYPEQKIPVDYYNLWRGFAVKELTPSDIVSEDAIKAVDLFQEHVLENVCDGDLDHYKWVMGWFAHIVQRPWEKPKTALVLQGRQGVGKSIIPTIIGRFFPQNYVAASSRRYMTGNFNIHLENTLLCNFEEAFWSGDKEAAGILKQLITGDDQQIEKKGKDSFTVDSCLRVIILGNEEWLVPAAAEERRYGVFQVGENRMQDHDFFGAMMKGIKDGGDRLLFTRLKHMDISGVDVSVAPKTSGLLKQKNQSLPVIEKWWFDCLSHKYIEGLQSDFSPGEWPKSADRSHLRSAFDEYMKQKNIRAWGGSDMSFNNFITKATKATMVVNKESRLWEFVLPEIQECRNLWDNYQGQKNEW